MKPHTRLSNPTVSAASLVIHEAAESAYRIWSTLSRQFQSDSLTSGAPLTEYQHNPLYAVKDGRGIWGVIAGFSAYQTLLPSLADGKKHRASILHYPDLPNDDVEVLSLRLLLSFVEDGCLDRSTGLERLRVSLASHIDKRVLARVCGTARMSRADFAARANVSASILKSQAAHHAPPKNKALGARHYVLERLDS